MNKNDILFTAVRAEQSQQLQRISQSDLTEGDIVQISKDTLHIIDGNHSRVVQVIKADYVTREFVLRIQDKDISVKLRDNVETRVHAMGFDVNRNHHKLRWIASPMPGMVLKILVREGSSVREGEPVIVLEAMKMENVLSAPADGVVRKIHIREKQNVDKNQVLVEF